MEADKTWRNCTAKASAELEAVHRNTIALLGNLTEQVDAFLARVPTQSVSFRGGEHSQATWRALCVFLLSLETQKRRLEEQLLAAAALRESLSRHFVQYAHAQLLSGNGEAEGDQSIVMCLMRWTEAIEHLLCEVFHRFLTAVNDASNAECNGARCDVGKVISLCGALKREVAGTEKALDAALQNEKKIRRYIP